MSLSFQARFFQTGEREATRSEPHTHRICLTAPLSIAKATLKRVRKELGKTTITYIVNNEKAIKELFGDHLAMMEISDAMFESPL